MFDYTKADAIAALKAVGIRPGAVVFSHSNIGYFGRAEYAKDGYDICALFLDAFAKVLGADGTLVAPTFTYSFGSDKEEKLFDVDATPSGCGMFTEFVRRHPKARRSADPLFSVAAIGPKAQTLTQSVDVECFGENSFWRRFLDCKGVICNLNFDAASTFIHFVERRLRVPYRQNRGFTGTLVQRGVGRKVTAVYFSRALDDPGAVPQFERFAALAHATGAAKKARLGRGAVLSISATDTLRLIEENIAKNPRFLTASAVDHEEAQ